MTRAEQKQLAVLRKALASLTVAARLDDKRVLENELAEVIAQGRLTALALNLDLSRMRTLAHAVWNEDLC